MDIKDYAAFVRFLNLTVSGEPDRARSPIIALHDEPLQPGWSVVAVIYSRMYYDRELQRWVDPDDGKPYRYAIYSYTPHAEGYGRYGRSWETTPAFSFQPWDGIYDENVKNFESMTNAMNAFISDLTEYVQNTP
jgi:hypothetical protein